MEKARSDGEAMALVGRFKARSWIRSTTAFTCSPCVSRFPRGEPVTFEKHLLHSADAL